MGISHSGSMPLQEGDQGVAMATPEVTTWASLYPVWVVIRLLLLLLGQGLAGWVADCSPRPLLKDCFVKEE